jgi:cyclophilin family peptidyl-prolyl cis-trans isomerase
VFGEVIEGMEVVDEIAGVATGRSGPYSDVPIEPVVIVSARREI